MRMTIIGKNPRADGSECVIFGHFNAETSKFAPVGLESRPQPDKRAQLSWQGGWELRAMAPGDDLDLAPALVGFEAGGDSCRTTGRLALVSHRWSGVLQINDIGRKYIVDLYSETTRLVLLDIVNQILVDVTRLAVAQSGALRLPDITADDVLRHIDEGHAWFRLIDPDPDFAPGALRRLLEALRRKPQDRLRPRLLATLLPRLVAPPAPPPPAPSLWEDTARLRDEQRFRDEFRLLAAAVEGLAQHNLAQQGLARPGPARA